MSDPLPYNGYCMKKVPLFRMSTLTKDMVDAVHLPERPLPTINLRLDRAQTYLDKLFPDGVIKLSVTQGGKRYLISRDED